MTKRPVLISGGGIGGLTTSIALARQGLESCILERSNFTEESGAGIQLGPNATRLLRKLGILDAIEAKAFRPEAIWLFDGVSGRRLSTVPLRPKAETRYGAPYLALHRADLHAGLLSIAKSTEKVELRSSFELAQIEAGPKIVAARSVGDGPGAEGSALIGADGLWSVVRKTVAPGARLRFAGATAFRTLLPLSGLPDPFSAPVVGLWLGPGAHLVHYPVRGGEALNLVAVTEGGKESRGWNQSSDPQTLFSGFMGWCKDPKSLLERAEAWRRWSLYRLSPLPYWSSGPVTLLGDAAHPVLPFLAQGAGLAIEDAVTLASALGAERDEPAAAFHTYELSRRARTSRLQQQSKRFGWIYHLRGPARLVRNFALRQRSENKTLSQFDWLYAEN